MGKIEQKYNNSKRCPYFCMGDCMISMNDRSCHGLKETCDVYYYYEKWKEKDDSFLQES